MTTPISRQERRRLQRAAAKDGPPAEIILAQQRSQLPLVAAMTGFVAASGAMSMVVGAEMWGGDFSWFFVLGWLAIFIVYGLAFWGWRTWKNRFVWRARWYVFIFMMLSAGIASGLTWAWWIEGRGQHGQFSALLERHQEVIDLSEGWVQGEAWDNKTCLAARKNQNSLIADVLQKDAAPNAPQINLVMAVEKVIYQAGCDHQWQKIDQIRRAPPARWAQEAPYRTERMMLAWSQLWPKMSDGCILDANRGKSLGLEREAVAVNGECATIPPGDGRLWIPEAILNAARDWVKRYPIAEKTADPKTPEQKK